MVGFERPQRIRTVVTERYRMSLRAGEDWDELYDLESDPNEIHNRYSDPAFVEIKSDMTEKMLRGMIDLQDRSPLPAYRA